VYLCVNADSKEVTVLFVMTAGARGEKTHVIRAIC
jgi:hypothetical protein